MKCMECPIKYVGEKGRIFYTRYEEHIQAIRNNNGNSGFFNHVLSTGHTYGSITDTMNIKSDKHLNTL
jgi:hypothetical protein